MDDIPYLRALTGDAWIDQEIFGQRPKHVLGLWQQRGVQTWLRYTEKLLKSISSTELIVFDRDILAAKIKSTSEFVPTLTELEIAVHLLAKGCRVAVEPTAPLEGPDFKVSHNADVYFVEVKALAHAEDDSQFNAVSNQVIRRLKDLPSSFTVALTVGPNYRSGDGKLSKALKQLIKSIGIAQKEGWAAATLHHSSVGTILNPGRPLNRSQQSLVDKADFVAHLKGTKAAAESTPVSIARPFERALQPDLTHERLRKKLGKKLHQIPENSKGVLVVDVSDLFMLSEFSINTALYGDISVDLSGSAAVTATMRQKGNGFFGKTSRVAAVVLHTRSVHKGEVQSVSRVFPTNRKNDDTLRFKLAELELFGEVEDREHLSSDYLP